MAEERILKHYKYPDNPSHIGIWVLPNGKDIVATIDRIAYVYGEKINGEKKNAWIAYFKPNPHFSLPMVINSRNRTNISYLTGEIYIEKVTNLTVTLTREMDKAFGGGKDWSLTISKIAPKITAQGTAIKNKLTPDSSNWGSVVAWAQIEGNKIEAVWAKYDVTQEDQVKFKEAMEVKA